MMGVQEQREQEAKHQRKLQKGRDQHDRRNGEGGVEEALRRGDEDARVNEPACVITAYVIRFRRKEGMRSPSVTTTVAAA